MVTYCARHVKGAAVAHGRGNYPGAIWALATQVVDPGGYVNRLWLPAQAPSRAVRHPSPWMLALSPSAAWPQRRASTTTTIITTDARADYNLVMSRCTAPVQGHRTASGRAACPACGGRRYEYYSPPRTYQSSGYTPRSGGGGGTSGGGGSVGGGTRPRWSPSSSSVTYTPDQVRALTPYRRTVELRGQQPELRDLFLCHAWDDRRGVATELCDQLEAEGVSVWFSEKDILLGQPFMREIDRGLAKSRAGLVLITPALLKRVDNRGVSDKELSELLARDQLIPVVHETTYEEIRKVSPLLGSRNGLDTAEDSMEVIATKIAELFALDDELVSVER